MNAFTASPGGAYPESMARCAMPGANDPFISIGLDGRRFRVFYQRGRAYWISAEMRDGHALPGVPLADCVPGCLHAQAAALADAFLQGLSRGVAAQIADWGAV
ncbi:hypothetical protein [Falsiroseomonas sp.]|uniref:hypothetical protein n=1 Tax=Falsiroseomonas sp. TaxID=2870721 RepID=UPI0027253672|nr:hypothetical protein [Falsiroseomonas sp.]MDO9499001.1 hypothetical protein [Falsiroseomonas sp.]